MKTKIKSLATPLKEYLELKEYSEKQFVALQEANKQIDKSKKEIEHLKKLLSDVIPSIEGTEKLKKSDEELICEMEIAKLYDQSTNRALTLEETKRLDLLVKNLRLAREQNTTIMGSGKKLPNNISEAQLINYVSSTEEPSDDEQQSH